METRTTDMFLLSVSGRSSKSLTTHWFVISCLITMDSSNITINWDAMESLRPLRCFVAVADALHFRRAAEDLLLPCLAAQRTVVGAGEHSCQCVLVGLIKPLPR
jgi:hypothetical protein